MTVLHVDLIRASAGNPPEAAARLLDEAAPLAAIPRMTASGAIQGSAGAVVLFFALEDLAALEAFGSDERYARFLRLSIGPALGRLCGADVRLESDFPDLKEHGACLALSAPDETYDWQVREALAGWQRALGSVAAAGLAIGERQQYRGLALAFSEAPLPAETPAIAGFQLSYVAGRVRALA